MFARSNNQHAGCIIPRQWLRVRGVYEFKIYAVPLPAGSRRAGPAGPSRSRQRFARQYLVDCNACDNVVHASRVVKICM